MQRDSYAKAKRAEANKGIDEAPPFTRKLVCGALAGLVGTAVMHRLHRRLGSKERYSLPPREIVEMAVPQMADEAATITTLLAHFGYGALSGAALSAVISKPTIGKGIAGGLSIWLASYMGWIPAFGILKPATQHPANRNALMNLAHVVWGAAYALTQRDLMRSASAFGGGRSKDAAANSVVQSNG